MISNMTDSAWHQIPNITKQGASAVVQTSHFATSQIVGSVLGVGLLAVGYFFYRWWKKQQGSVFKLIIFDDKKNFRIVEKKLEDNKFFSHEGNKYLFVEDAVLYKDKAKPFLFYKRGVSMPLILQDKKKLTYLENSKMLNDAVDTKLLSEFLTLKTSRSSNIFANMDTNKIIFFGVIVLILLYVLSKTLSGGRLI